MATNRDTFVRFAARTLRWAVGERAHRLTSVVAGLLPDTIADGVRQMVRWTMPLLDTPVDALPHLLRMYGMPTYDETYERSLNRLRRPVETHATAGSLAMLEAELVRAGLDDGPATIETQAGSSFWVRYGSGLTPTYGIGLEYGVGDAIYGTQVSSVDAHNAIRMMLYYRPARERWNGFIPV